MDNRLSIKCDCLKRIEAKYIAIRNEAMKDMKLMPYNTVWDEQTVKEQNTISERVSKVMKENSPKYYLELIGLEHSANCKGMAEIHTYIVNDSRRLEIIKRTQNEDAYKNEIENLKQKWIAQKEKADKELKEWVTSRLGEINGNSIMWYWTYVNSIQHLNSYSELTGVNAGWEKKILEQQEQKDPPQATTGLIQRISANSIFKNDTTKQLFINLYGHEDLKVYFNNLTTGNAVFIWALYDVLEAKGLLKTIATNKLQILLNYLQLQYKAKSYYNVRGKKAEKIYQDFKQSIEAVIIELQQAK